MRTTALKNIAGYLPHGLKFKYYDPERMSEEIVQLSTVLVDSWDTDYSHYYSGMNDYDLIPGEALPILRPLSDLYLPIKHNGKEIVPIVECAKKTLSDLDWSDGNWYISEQTLRHKYSDIWISYDKDGFMFTALFNQMNACLNQIEVFDFFHALKIDYRGLIDAGLAVDANKLKINGLDVKPYNK